MGIWEYFRVNFGPFFGFVRILLSPLTAAATTPVQLIRTMRDCRKLWQGRDWSKTGGQLSPYGAFVMLAYSTYAKNFEKFGVKGVSSLMGFGEFNMGTLWHYSLFPLYAFKALGPVIPIAGMFAWLIAHVAWVPMIPLKQLVPVLAMALASTGFYMSAFARQSYHPIGWMFFPIALASMHAQQYLLASLFFLLTGIFSITASILTIFLIILYGLFLLTPCIWLLALPNVLWLLLKMMLSSKDIRQTLNFIFDMLTHTAMTKKNKFSLFKTKLNKYGKQELIYFMLLYGQLIFAVYFDMGHVPLLLLCGFVLFMINGLHIFYFGDSYLCLVFHLSLATASVLASPGIVSYVSLWLFLSPMPFFLNMPPTPSSPDNRVLDIVPKYSPVDIGPVIEGAREFLMSAGTGKRVIALFPGKKLSQKRMEHLFLLQYVGTCKDILIMPDQFARLEVFKMKSSPIFDGTPSNAVEWMKLTKADFVIASIIEDDAPEWEKKGFTTIAQFDWSRYPLASEGWLGIDYLGTWQLLKLD